MGRKREGGREKEKVRRGKTIKRRKIGRMKGRKDEMEGKGQKKR